MTARTPPGLQSFVTVTCQVKQGELRRSFMRETA